jgi:hypothetical protein
MRGTLIYIPLNNTEVDRKGREFYFWATHHNQLFQIQQMTQSVSLRGISFLGCVLVSLAYH